ncbi:MAG: hypothetical protein M5U08_25770 [Burkholderiales bacterium]|nr:hypothetical protein [Burkholderiales bacterium]
MLRANPRRDGSAALSAERFGEMGDLRALAANDALRFFASERYREMSAALRDTGALFRDVSWLVMSSLLALAAIDVDGWEAQKLKQQQELAWHVAITVNALNSRDMLVGGNIFVNCRATTITQNDPLLEPARSQLRWAASDYAVRYVELD